MVCAKCLKALKVNQTFLCKRESVTADVADLVPICTLSAKETLGMFLTSNSDTGGRRPRKEVASEGGVSDTSHNFCIFNLVDLASSHILVPQSSALVT